MSENYCLGCRDGCDCRWVKYCPGDVAYYLIYTVAAETRCITRWDTNLQQVGYQQGKCTKHGYTIPHVMNRYTYFTKKTFFAATTSLILTSLILIFL